MGSGWGLANLAKKKEKLEVCSAISIVRCQILILDALMLGWFLTSSFPTYEKKSGFHSFWGSSWVPNDAFTLLTFNNMYETFLFIYLFLKREKIKKQMACLGICSS